jgi:hypothetical protein
MQMGFKNSAEGINLILSELSPEQEAQNLNVTDYLILLNCEYFYP